MFGDFEKSEFSWLKARKSAMASLQSGDDNKRIEYCSMSFESFGVEYDEHSLFIPFSSINEVVLKLRKPKFCSKAYLKL